MYKNEVFTNLTYLNEERNLLFKNSSNVWLVSRKINLIAMSSCKSILAELGV